MQKTQSKQKSIGNYIITKNLGQGTFGKVKLGIHSITNQKVAIKVLQKSKIIDVADVQRVTRQIHILKQIRHPNLIQLYQIIQTPRQLFLVMQHVSEGQLFQYIVKKKRLKQNQACEFFKQLIEGVQYIHTLNIVHRDLKPENLLIDFNKRLKIVDFGLSNTYKNKQLLKTACGSPCYAAPQMISGKKYQPLNADIWSCGVILFAMICGYLPFEDPNTSNLYKKIIAGDFTIPKFVSPFARELLLKILNTDPQKRYKISDIKKHSWYRQPIQLQFKQTYGIKIGSHNIPIDENILSEVVKCSPELGYEQTRKFIANNRHNHAITIYYLLLKKDLRNNILSTYDICSPNFDALNLQKKIINADAQGQVKNKRNNNDDIEQIQLDRNTTATGARTFRAFNRVNRSLISNNQSPDITAHNFYVSTSKPKSMIQKPQNILIKSIQAQSIYSNNNKNNNNINNNNNIKFDTHLIQLNEYQPTTNNQRRKIYYQKNRNQIVQKISGLEKNLINPQKQKEKQKKQLQALINNNNNNINNNINNNNIINNNSINNNSINIDKINHINNTTQIKDNIFNQYYVHTQRIGTASSSIRQPVTFRSNLKNKIRLSNQLDKQKKTISMVDNNNFNDTSRNYNILRQQLTVQLPHHQRYASLNISTRDQSRSHNRQKQSIKNNMNKTFMGKISKTYGLKAQNQTERFKSILNSTIGPVGGFGTGKKRTYINNINGKSKDITNRLRFNF